MRVTLVLPLVVASLGAGCPTPVSLLCVRCAAADECAPQGYMCVAGRCAHLDADCSAAGEGGGATLPALGVVPVSTLIVQDDFERGLSLGPAGTWTLVDGGASNFDVAVGADARAGVAALFAHRVAGGANSGNTLRHDLPSTQADMWLRAWVQLDTTPLHVSALSTYRPYTPSVDLSDVASDLSIRGDWLFQGYVPGEKFEWFGAAWDAGWHRVQLRMRGVDTATGSATIFIDNDTSTKALMLPQARLTQVAFGPAYFDNAWVGALHIDNIAVTQGGPPPGKLTWVQSSPPSNGCVPVRLELRDDLPSGGELAKAVRATTIGLGGAAFYSDASCSSAISQVTVSAGAAVKDFWMSASAGTVSLTANDLGADLASARVTWAVP
jgi:hypothetical protein